MKREESLSAICMTETQTDGGGDTFHLYRNFEGNM